MRNAVLVFDGAAIPLRSTTTIEAPRVELSSKVVKLPIDAPLWGLDPKELRIEAIEIVGTPLQARVPSDGVGNHDQSVRLVLRDEVPKAIIEVSLSGKDPVYVDLKPVIIGFDKRQIPWTQKRVESLLVTYGRQIKADQGALEAAQRDVAAQEVRLANAKKQTLLAEQRKVLDQWEKALPMAKEALAKRELRLQEFSAAIEGFSQVTKSVHESGRLSFRVFYRTGEDGQHEVTILQAKM